MSKQKRQEPQAEQVPQAQVEVPNTLAGALLVAQASISGVGKDSRNSFHKYSYTSAEGMIAACRQALHGAGLAFSRIGWELSQDGQTVDSEFLLQHPASASVMSFRVPWLVVVEKGRPVDKALAGALTTSMGYFLRDLLLLPREDEDGSMDRRNDDPKGAMPDVGFRRQQPQAPQAEQPRNAVAELNAKLMAARPEPSSSVVLEARVNGYETKVANGKQFKVLSLSLDDASVRTVVVPGELQSQVEALTMSAGGMGWLGTFTCIDRGDKAAILEQVVPLRREQPAQEEDADDGTLPF